jgi:hypothetical protein
LQWIQLEADDSTGLVDEDYKAGLISLKISIAYLPPSVLNEKGETSDDFLAVNPKWKDKPPRRMNSYIVRAYIF